MKTPRQSWYVAVVIVEAIVQGRKEKRPLYDRQIKLLQAASHEEAYKKAIALGKEETHYYRNSKGERVAWRFVCLSNLDLVREKISDGLEIYSTLQRGNPKKEVFEKKQMSIFWYESNKRRTVGQLLGDRQRPYAPASLAENSR